MKIRAYNWKSFTITRNDYEEEVKTYGTAVTVYGYMQLKDTLFNTNDIIYKDATHLFTTHTTPARGDLIDGKEVVNVVPGRAGGYNVVWLKEVV